MTTTHDRLAQATIAKMLMFELMSNFNRIKSFRPTVNNIYSNMLGIVRDFQPNPQYDTHLQNFVNNMNRYVPQIYNIDGQPNAYLDALKAHINELGLIESNMDSFRYFGVNTKQQFQDLVSIPVEFVEGMSGAIFSGSLETIIRENPFKEMSLATDVAILQFNMQLQNIGNSINNILDSADLMVTHFQSYANLEFIDGIVSDLPNMAKDMFFDLDGNLDISNLMGTFALIDNWFGLPENVVKILNTIDAVGSTIRSIRDLMVALHPGMRFGGCPFTVVEDEDMSQLQSAIHAFKSTMDYMGDVVDAVGNVIDNVEDVIDPSGDALSQSIQNKSHNIRIGQGGIPKEEDWKVIYESSREVTPPSDDWDVVYESSTQIN